MAEVPMGDVMVEIGARLSLSLSKLRLFNIIALAASGKTQVFTSALRDETNFVSGKVNQWFRILASNLSNQMPEGTENG
ncbi:hypothetical protein [Tateyamaria sp.]|uniref:hypothetical protein n=1 Tax=Tateyamaria sp. TaxID=1929288 RepID=UPI00329CB9D4